MTEQTVISVLAWSAVTLGTAFIACLLWFALRIVRQGEVHTEQLDEMKTIFMDEIHKHDIRIVRLEERAGTARRADDLYHQPKGVAP